MLTGSVSVAAAETAPAATIAQGRLAGARTGDVERFLDIPFAAAPVGALRWRAPQAPPRWRGVRDAAKLGPACPQTVRPALVAGGVAEHQSEDRSEEHTSELQSLMRISYAVFCLKKKKNKQDHRDNR